MSSYLRQFLFVFLRVTLLGLSFPLLLTCNYSVVAQTKQENWEYAQVTPKSTPQRSQPAIQKTPKPNQPQKIQWQQQSSFNVLRTQIMYSQILIMSSLDKVLFPLKSSLWLGTVLFPIQRVQTSTDKVLAFPGQILIKSSLSGIISRIKAREIAIFDLGLLHLQTYQYKNRSHQCSCSFNGGWQDYFTVGQKRCLDMIPELFDQRQFYFSVSALMNHQNDHCFTQHP